MDDQTDSHDRTPAEEPTATDRTAAGPSSDVEGAETPGDSAGADAPPPGAGRRLGRGAVIGIVIAAVVVIVVAVVAIVASVSAARTDAARRAASASVTAYLTAVAHDDAAGARARLSDAAGLNQTVLTDAALKASGAAAPLTGIAVSTPTEGTTDDVKVAATYRIGSTPVSTLYDVRRSAGGQWRITNGTGRVTVSIDGFTGMRLLVNGVALPGSSELDAFPGTYTLTTSTRGFAIGGTATALVTGPGSSLSLAGAKPRLTSTGLQTFRFAIDRGVKGCISSHRLKAGCGLALPGRLPDGTTLVDGTVQRSLPGATKAKLASVTPTQSASDGVTLATDGLGPVNVTVHCVKGGRKGVCQIANGNATFLGGPVVDMSHNPPAVTWPAH